jgi:hypothetical protein
MQAIQFCYDDRDAAQITMYGQPRESNDFYNSLTDITMEPPPVNKQTYLKLSYQQLKQLQNVGRNPFWDDEAFWIAKTDQDFPNEQGIGGTARLRYLYLFTTPSLEFRTDTGRVRLSLDYPTGAGLLTCRYLLGLELSLEERLPISSLRILGSSYFLGEKVANGLYHINFPDPDYPDPANDDNLNLNLIATETEEGLDIHIPNILDPYVMEMLSLNGSKTFYLQFSDRKFFEGYLILCRLIGIKPNAKLYKVKSG